MDFKSLNEYEYKTMCFFFRFLKENGMYVYNKYKLEAFEQYYKSYLNSLTTEEGFSYAFNIWYSEEERKLINNKLFIDINVDNHKIGYKEFIIRRIKYANSPIWYLSLLRNSARSAWYYDKNGKLTIHIDWKVLENLWFLTIIEDNTDLFDEDDKQIAKIILKERCVI